MNLRCKVFLIVISGATIATFSINIMCKNIFMKRFLSLENKRILLDEQRATNVIDKRLKNLSSNVLSWSSSDDISLFVKGKAPNYCKKNLTYDAVHTLFDIAIYCDINHQVVHSVKTNHQTKSLDFVSQDNIQHILQNKKLLQHNHVKGFLNLNTPVMIVSRPITKKNGPIIGTLIWCYYLTSSRCKQLLEKPLQLQVVMNTDCSGCSKKRCLNLNVNTAYSCKAYSDINNNKIFSLEITHNRDIYLQGLESFKLFTLFLILMGLILTLLILFFLETSILSRLEKATKHIKMITENKKYRQLKTEGQDEFTTLTTSINKMLESLQEEQKAAEESLNIATQEIAKRQMTELRLQKAIQYAEEINASKDIFLASISHEIRTPMSGIIGLVGLLEEENLNAQQKNWIKTIRESSKILLSIMNDILDFTKIESGRLELEKQHFCVRECLESVINLFSAKANEKNIDLICDIDFCTPQYVIGDTKRVRQIFINLINNAIKFTNSGEVITSVSHRQEKENLFLEVQVKDTGIGIPQKKLQSIFEPFLQADNSTSRIYGGTGLGLSICKKLVEIMDGNIHCQSILNNGTIFSFSIKVQKSNKVNNIEYLDPSIDYMFGKNVLIDIKSPIMLELLQKYCCWWGLKVSIEHNIEENYDLIISDRTLFVNQTTPALLINTNKKAYLPPNTVVLNKPINISSFFNATKNILCDIKYKKKCVVDKSNFMLYLEYPLDIILVEDNSINQKVAGFLLEELGYNIDIVSDGLEAVNAIKQKKYDLVFMDMQMPIMDGLEATKIIISTQIEAPVIIAMTANAMEKDREECFNAGMNDYISKPITMIKLQNIIKKWGKVLLEQKIN
ncbi:response regulator [Candidatus Uabimicrobium sp. HlEnr_7]|uniref:response regulator n=1 Tax=Candidatus Uabimicrobium helgolandensis TaxID=3095367 RepID=UPI003557BD97